MVVLNTPDLTVLISTLLIQTVCWKLLLLGSHVMRAEVLVTLLALTQEGPSGASLPMIMVQAASLEARRFTRTVRTLMR